MTRDYVRRWLGEELKQLFVDDDYAEVVNWMSIHRGIPKVVLIGSGFSRNAVLKSGLNGNVGERTPLWPQVTEALRRGLGYRHPNEGPSDPLLLAEQYQESIGLTEFRTLLLKMLRDEELEPGEAHNALQKFPAEAIITTNQLDTLLDRMEGRWHPVIGAGDLPLSRAQSSLAEMKGSTQVIYLHGHRSLPDTWVFSRSEYEDINALRPALVNRVQQLLAEYPLLVLGYSLSDPDFHALFRLVHSRLESCKPRALCVTVGTKRPLRAEKTHWLNLGMYLAHMRDPGNDEYAPGLARFLRLEESFPAKSYVKKSLNAFGHGSITSILRSRLTELRSIYDELEKIEPSDHALAELYYDSWKTCFPGLDQHEKDAKVREERLVQQRLAEYHGQGARMRGTQQSNSVPELRNLPVERFVRFWPSRVFAYVSAVDKVLDQEEHRCAALAVAEWIAFAIERRVLHSRAATLAYGEEGEVLQEILRWCAEQASGDPECERYEELLKLCVRDTLDPLLVSMQSSGAWERSPYTLPQMDDAWRAVWSVSHDLALAKYDEAARVFRRRGESLGEWAALVGVVHTARELRWGVRSRDSARCAELEKSVSDAQSVLAELEQRRPVRRFVGRKRRVTEEALVMAERAASEPGREPGQRRTRFSTTQWDLVSLLHELATLRCHPRELRRGVELAMKLNALTGQEAVSLGLQYNIESMGEWLRRQARLGSPGERKALSEGVGAAARSIAAGIGDNTRFLPQTCLVTFSKILDSAKHVLDAKSAATMLPGLLCLRREFGKNGGAIEHAFGWANLLFSFAVAFVSLAQCAAGQAGAARDVFKAIREYVDPIGIDDQRERIWASLAGFEWGTLLADDEFSAEEIVGWLASKLAGELSTDDVLSCADAVESAIADMRRLGRTVSQETQLSVVDAVEIRLRDKPKVRTRFALLALLSRVDPEAARQQALACLERYARAVKETNTEQPPEQGARGFHWAVVEVVERGLVPAETVRQSLPVIDALRTEVAAICMREVTEEEVQGGRELDFTVVAYSLLFDLSEASSRKWLIQKVWQMQEPPMGTLGLCLDAEVWGESYPELVASLLARANDTRLFETFRMINNAVHDGRYLEAVVRGDFAWALVAALQQLDNESELGSNGAAWSIMQVARQLNDEFVNLPIGHAVCRGLQRCAESPSFLVRVAVAFGLAKLAHTSCVESVRRLASQLVGSPDNPDAGGLVNDYSGIVQALVRYGDRVGRVQVELGCNS